MLQLVGISCLVLAAKYEEIQSVSIHRFAACCGDLYTTEQIVAMEAQILKVLHFDMLIDTPITYLETLFDRYKATSKVQNFARFLVDLALLDGETRIGMRAALIAGAIVVASLHVRTLCL